MINRITRINKFITLIMINAFAIAAGPDPLAYATQKIDGLRATVMDPNLGPSDKLQAINGALIELSFEISDAKLSLEQVRRAFERLDISRLSPQFDELKGMLTQDKLFLIKAFVGQIREFFGELGGLDDQLWEVTRLLDETESQLIKLLCTPFLCAPVRESVEDPYSTKVPPICVLSANKIEAVGKMGPIGGEVPILMLKPIIHIDATRDFQVCMRIEQGADALTTKVTGNIGCFLEEFLRSTNCPKGLVDLFRGSDILLDIKTETPILGASGTGLYALGVLLQLFRLEIAKDVIITGSGIFGFGGTFCPIGGYDKKMRAVIEAAQKNTRQTYIVFTSEKQEDRIGKYSPYVGHYYLEFPSNMIDCPVDNIWSALYFLYQNGYLVKNDVIIDDSALKLSRELGIDLDSLDPKSVNPDDLSLDSLGKLFSQLKDLPAMCRRDRFLCQLSWLLWGIEELYGQMKSCACRP